MSSPPPDPDLIAYLDGELDEAAARAVEARLAADPSARRRADGYRKTFALLDALPRPAPPADFTALTLTRLRPAAPTLVAPARPRRRGRLLSVAAVLVAGLVGAGARLATKSAAPAAPLLADLPAVESLPLYLGADDLGFVRRLDAPDLFAGPTGSHAPADPSPEVRDKLLALFAGLPPARREQVRTLHADLHALPPPERDRLGGVLERYATWLDRLPDADRATVLRAPDPDARLVAVRDAVLTSRREALPARLRERLSALRTDERLKLLADVQDAEAAARGDWDRAFERWQKLAAPGARPWPFDTPDGAAGVTEFVRGVLRADVKLDGGEVGRLSPAEAADLRARHDAAGKDGAWFLYGLGVYRLAERHPSLPRPRGKPAVLSARDLPDLKVRPQVVRELDRLPGAGRWPEFARGAAGVLTSKRLAGPLPTDVLGPCRPGEFADPVEAAFAELLPSLSADERKRLDAARGKWPDYPELLVKLARDRDRPVPGVTLPGPPSRWAATYGAADRSPTR